MAGWQRRRFLLGTVAAIAAAQAAAQPARRTPRIGYLLLTPITDPPSPERQAFLDGMRELGYVPGRTLTMLYRSAEGEADFLDAVARELVALAPDVIVVAGEPAAVAAKRATTTVPIVLLGLGDPVGIGIVPSLARPGGNVTGVSFISSDLASKRLEFALACVPGVKRIAILSDRRNTNSQAEARSALAAAQALGLHADLHASDSDTALAQALERTAAARSQVVYVTFEGSGLAAAHRTAIAQFGLRQRTPVVSGWHSLTEAGGLLSYAADIPAMFRRAALHVDRVLNGARPGDLAIELPTKIDLVLNTRTARALGITFPQDMLLRAERQIP